METTALLSRNSSNHMDQRRWRVPHPPTDVVGAPSSPPRQQPPAAVEQPRPPRVGGIGIITGGDGTAHAALATTRAAVATRGPSRQFFYGNTGLWSSAYQPNSFGSPSYALASSAAALQHAPSDSLSNSASGRHSSSNHLVLQSVPVTATSTDSTADDATVGPIHPPPERARLPSPRQLHEDYSHRLHRNQVAGGRRNFVVGGAMGRYRDYEGELVEVPEEVRAVRTAALTVLWPLTYCWVSFLFWLVSFPAVPVLTFLNLRVELFTEIKTYRLCHWRWKTNCK